MDWKKATTEQLREYAMINENIALVAEQIKENNKEKKEQIKLLLKQKKTLCENIAQIPLPFDKTEKEMPKAKDVGEKRDPAPIKKSAKKGEKKKK